MQIFFSDGRHDYSWYLTLLGVFLKYLNDTHTGCKEFLQIQVISVARFWISVHLSTPDRTREKTSIFSTKQIQ